MRCGCVEIPRQRLLREYKQFLICYLLSEFIDVLLAHVTQAYKKVRELPKIPISCYCKLEQYFQLNK